MERTHSKRRRLRLPAHFLAMQLLTMTIARVAALCGLLLLLFSAPLLAQGMRYPLQDNAAKLPSTPDDRVVVDKNDSKQNASKTKSCTFQPFPGLATSVSVTSLQIPRKAQKEYEQACADLTNNELPEAEQHLRKATEIYPKYALGWVILGEILETLRQTGEAHNACMRASNTDPKYLPAYLCLAGIAGRDQQWNEVLSLTGRALELDSVNDAHAYFFPRNRPFQSQQTSRGGSERIEGRSDR